MNFEITSVKSIKNDKFVICVLIDNFGIFERFKNFIIFIIRVDFDILNIFVVKNIFHSKPFALFCHNDIKKYSIELKQNDLFVARAILAGFNASNVDVRSSRYDAIVDFDDMLLRIQIKGISNGEIISFKDRDRGGQGIDHTHERNRGKRITKADCDIYVAVDKQVGICYLIPMSFADTLSDDECNKVRLEQVQNFKENWEVIKEVAKEKLKNLQIS